MTGALSSGAGTGYCSDRGDSKQSLPPEESDRPDGDRKTNQVTGVKISNFHFKILLDKKNKINKTRVLVPKLNSSETSRQLKGLIREHSLRWKVIFILISWYHQKKKKKKQSHFCFCGPALLLHFPRPTCTVCAAPGAGACVDRGSEQGSSSSLEVTGLRRRETAEDGWRI